MKIVKLDRRYRAYKNSKFEVALMFENGWDRDARRMQDAVQAVLGPEVSFMWKWHMDAEPEENWATRYTTKSGSNRGAYWIYIKTAAMLTLVLLKADYQP